MAVDTSWKDYALVVGAAVVVAALYQTNHALGWLLIGVLVLGMLITAQRRGTLHFTGS